LHSQKNIAKKEKRAKGVWGRSTGKSGCMPGVKKRPLRGKNEGQEGKKTIRKNHRGHKWGCWAKRKNVIRRPTLKTRQGGWWGGGEQNGNTRFPRKPAHQTGSEGREKVFWGCQKKGVRGGVHGTNFGTNRSKG